MPRRLRIKGGFRVDGDHYRHLDQQARRLGFAELRACLRALLEDGWSIPQLATHPGSTQAAIRRAIVDHHIHQPSRRELLARQRQRAADQRAAARAAELGFASVRAYLVDRVVAKAWTLAQVRGELGAASPTLRRLLDHHQVRRVAPTRRQRAAAAAASGPKQQMRAVQQRCQARLGPSLASKGWRSTDEIGISPKAGRCGGWAPSSGWVMAGWMGSFAGSACAPDHQCRVAAGVGGAVEAGGLTTITISRSSTRRRCRQAW